MSDENVELRGLCPRDTVDVLDAVAMHRRLSRTDVVNAVLAEWAKDRIHEATLIVRITRANGSLGSDDGGGK